MTRRSLLLSTQNQPGPTVSSLSSNTVFPVVVAALLLLLTACSSSGSGNANPSENQSDNSSSDNITNMNSDGMNTEGSTDEGNQTGNDTPIDTSGFDLAEYQFGANVRTAGGEIPFSDINYDQETGEQSFLTITRRFANPTGNTIEEYGSGELIKTFVINASTINETLLNGETQSRISQRFLNTPGMVYMDADSPPAEALGGLIQNATCTFVQHLDSFDLATATGEFTLASGVYEDVIEVSCVTGFISNGTKSPHTTITSYFAKDVGVIFSVGTVLLLGDVYIIHEY